MGTSHVIFGHYKLKSIGYVVFFKRKEHSAAFTSSIYSSTVAKTKNKDSTATYTSAKNTSNEVSGEITSVNEPQKN